VRETAFALETVWLDLPALTGAFSRRLHDAGVPSGPERSVHFAQALTLVAPVSRRRLYWTARAVFVSDSSQVKAFDTVFADVFGALSYTPPELELAPDELRTVPVEPDERPASEREGAALAEQPIPSLLAGAASLRSDRSSEEDDGDDVPIPLVPSDEELLRGKRFDSLQADELAALYRLMSKLEIAPPLRRTRRAKRDHHGERIDLRRTLRGSLRTGGDPVALARRRRRIGDDHFNNIIRRAVR
jgi:uncharacterized protein with von Willebrand factor type A (vWA) domain